MFVQTAEKLVRHHFVLLQPDIVGTGRVYGSGDEVEIKIKGFPKGGAAEFAYRLRGLIEVKADRDCQLMETLPRDGSIENLSAERMNVLNQLEEQAEQIESNNQE